MAPKRKAQGASKAKNETKKPKTGRGGKKGGKAEAVLPSLADSQSYCKEVGIDMESGGSLAVFQWLCCSIVFGNRISEKTTIRAAKGLINSGLTDPKSVRDSSQWDKVEALNSEGNVQRGPSMASRLESTAALILDKYDGDVEKLREKADKDADQIKKLIKECKGIGETGVNIFCREAQLAWPELYPFADKKSLQLAGKHGFPNGSAKELADFCNDDRATFVTLLAAMTKDDLRNGKKAGSSKGDAKSQGNKNEDAQEAKTEEVQDENSGEEDKKKEDGAQEEKEESEEKKDTEETSK